MDRRRSRVLVVDDDEDIREVVGDVLGLLDLQVAFAGDGREALTKLESFEADLIITDLQMPGVDGCALIKRLRQDARLAGTKICILSADHCERCAIPSLRKPFELTTLLSTIRTLLA